MFDAIVAAIKDIGWNPADIKKFIISHGHFDHTGCGKWVIDAFHPEVYMGEIDYHFWTEHPYFPDKKDTLKDFDVHNFIGDGDEVTLGDKTVKVFFTPGHTPGTLSFIFPVTDLGVPHVAGYFGGPTPPPDLSAVIQLLRSQDYFLLEAEKNHVDVALGAHCFHDNGMEKIACLKNRLSHMPNVYVLGERGFRQYLDFVRIMCYNKLQTFVK
jgi:metallo-beta-lactamase class B